MKIRFSIVSYNSELYFKTIALRYEVLRRPLGLEFTSEQLLKECNDYHLAGSDENGNLHCCLVLTPIDIMTVQMRQVVVENTMRGKGIGGKLVEYSEEIAKEKGFKIMILHARESAIEFYLKHNYEVVGEPFQEVNIPHRFMRKSLVERN
ncbi:MAG: GNAT family N-acetyltransferase [Bacteroidetes bacterium]|nr:GNAT family N-acetyltransferase [Bacteroidota bacterium]